MSLHVAQALADLGPRFTGTPADAQAADLMVHAFGQANVAAAKIPFHFTGWALDAPAQLTITAPHNRTVPCAAMIRSGSGSVHGTLVAAGRRSVVGVFQWESYHIVDSQGRVVGLIIEREDGPAIPQCLDEPLPIPAVIVGNDWRAGMDDVPLGAIAVTLTTGCQPVPEAISYNVATPLLDGNGAPQDAPAAEILVCAHHDSMYTSPGANDNASGAHVLVALAQTKLDLPPDVGVRYVSFGGEEWIQLGSQAYLDQRRAAGDLDRIRLVLNIDMVGKGDYLWPSVTDVTQPLFATAVSATLPDTQVIYHNPPMKGDHYPFHTAGIPAIMLLWWPDAVYHTADDRATTLSPIRLDQSTQLARHLIELAARQLAGKPG